MTNARFIVSEGLLPVVAIGGRVIQNAFVFLVYPIFFFGEARATWLSALAVILLSGAVGGAVLYSTGNISDSTIALAATALVSGLEMRVLSTRKQKK